MSNLTPEYLTIDFNTFVENLKTQIAASDVFRDVDYEGSNISIIIELFAYISELNTYYTNKLAKNQFIDTADVYDNVHRLANFLGYYPKGNVSSSGTITVTASGSGWTGKTFTINEWQEFSTEELVDENGDLIYFTSTDTISASATSDIITIDVPVKQGIITKYTNDITDVHRKDAAYYGSDLIDNKLYLPFLHFDDDDNIDDNYKSIRVFINDVEWTRISDFYDDISGLTDTDTVFTFRYNSENQHVIYFSSNRQVPASTDTIEVWLLESIGIDGNITIGAITAAVDTEIITNETDATAIDNDAIISITNTNFITGGADAENITAVKTNAKAITHTQYRNVTSVDYINFLNLHTDIANSIVWGEQDENPDGGSVLDYNKVYLSMIPSGDISTWSDKLTCNTHTSDSGTILYIPITNGYTQTFKDEISTYLEPRKMICAYEEYTVPEILYFSFNLGLKIKANYKYINVLRDLKLKLAYYFSVAEREFGETIEFTDLIYKMLDITYISSTNNFPYTRGLQNLIIRDIEYFDTNTLTWININNDTTYPMWDETSDSSWEQNTLRDISLSRKQFPYIDIAQCTFSQE